MCVIGSCVSRPASARRTIPTTKLRWFSLWFLLVFWAKRRIICCFGLRRLSEIFFLLIISRNRPFSRMERKIEYFNTFRFLAEKIKLINPYPPSRHRSVSKNHRITQKNCEKFLLVFRYFVILKTSIIQCFYKYFYYIGIALWSGRVLYCTVILIILCIFDNTGSAYFTNIQILNLFVLDRMRRMYYHTLRVII